MFGHSDAFAFWEDDLKYEGESVYNYLQVKEDERSVVLSTNVLFGVQSVMMKEGGLTGLYYDYALAVMESVFHTDADDVIATKNKAVQNESTKRHCADERQETQNIL